MVATPIGNLEDITARALRLLREADLIACEDTRHSRKLLEHFGIQRPLVSYYRENEQRRSEEILDRLHAGATVALISDAGTPLLSDPGAAVVSAAVSAGIPVVPVPGASAPLAALMGAGTQAEPVLFAGFLPARAGERRRWLESWKAFAGTIVVLESPHRIQSAAADIAAVLGPARSVVVARELTKVHEEWLRGPAAEIAAQIAAQPPRGEYTLVIGPALPQAAAVPDDALDHELRRLARSPDDPRPELKRLARASGRPRSEIYRRLQEFKSPNSR